jgi:hypothetical protein
MTCARRVRDDPAKVMRCLRESLRGPAFASALALVLFGKRQDKQRETAERRGFGKSAENGKG